ncbi:MAG: DUF1343 domain-containing protein [Gemmatimonadaceae bacterium]
MTVAALGAAAGVCGCASHNLRSSNDGGTPSVQPGITVLLEDSIGLIRGKRIGLITNQTGVDRNGVSDIDLLRGTNARAAGVTLVKLFSPEHGIRGTEDREHVESGVDEKSGLPVHSLYTQGTIAPPDSLLRDIDALVLDLQDIGTRTWTYVGSMVYAIRAAARRGLPLIVLDRPNPISGDHVDGPMLDTGLSNAAESSPGHPGKAYALYPFPLRHGMTMGEMALFYNGVLGIRGNVHVVPVRGWRREMWWDDTGLPWVRPSPNLPTLTSALTYPSLVPFEGSNLSVGRGTSRPFEQFGASWLNATRVADILNARKLGGVRFVAETISPVNSADGKFNGKTVPAVLIDVTDRTAVQAGRISAAILSAVVAANKDSLRITARTFDERFGSTSARAAIVAGEDPDTVLARGRSAVEQFLVHARPYRIYR